MSKITILVEIEVDEPSNFELESLTNLIEESVDITFGTDVNLFISGVCLDD